MKRLGRSLNHFYTVASEIFEKERLGKLGICTKLTTWSVSTQPWLLKLRKHSFRAPRLYYGSWPVPCICVHNIQHIIAFVLCFDCHKVGFYLVLEDLIDVFQWYILLFICILLLPSGVHDDVTLSMAFFIFSVIFLLLWKYFLAHAYFRAYIYVHSLLGWFPVAFLYFS